MGPIFAKNILENGDALKKQNKTDACKFMKES